MATFKYIGQFNGESNPLTVRILKKDGTIQEVSNVIPGETEIITEDERSLRYLRSDTNHFQEIL